jgi:hypothetical protein
MKKILFISPLAFKEINGGSVLFEELFKYINPFVISWFICSETNKNSIFSYNFKNISYYNSRLFNNSLLNIIARKIRVFGIVFFVFKYKLVSYFSSLQAINLIRNEKINFLWIYAYHFSIPVAKKLIKKFNIPFHLSIQDDIHTHLPGYESKFLEDDFKFLLENASSIDFISQEMKKYYLSKYNIVAKTTILILNKEIRIGKPILSKTIKRIGYAGNIWCGENFISLFEALKHLEDNYSIFIKVIVFSNIKYSHTFENYHKFIEYHSVLEYKDLIPELQKCELLYLPMSFSPEKKITNITSFPSKILAYLNSKIPILNHSPIEAVSHKFVIENEVGYSINILNKESIVDFFLSATLQDIERRKYFSENAESVLMKFNKDKMVPDLLSLLLN